MIKAIVTKSGNSYALRVPKRFIDDNHLKLGDEVQVEEPLARQRAAIAALVELGQKRGPIKGWEDPVAWQREQRAQWRDPWDEVEHDSPRH